ncbi:MAG: hypothetical protein R2699_11550 [Acidimicrobiales bacterium]
MQTASRPDAAVADGVVQVVLVDGTGTPGRWSPPSTTPPVAPRRR